MSDFNDTRRKYLEAKKNFDAAVEKRYQVRQQFYLLEKEIGLFLRQNLLSRLPGGHPLNKRKKEIMDLIGEVEKNLSTTLKALESSRTEFDGLGSADLTIGNLDDEIPVLLMPLQVQTRFQTIKHIARDCPDELLIDVNKVDPNSRTLIKRVLPGLEPVADPVRISGSQAFLLSNIDSPAARALITKLVRMSVLNPEQSRWQKVEDRHELWVRIFPDDIFLQNHEKALTGKETEEAIKFWQAMWKAERDFRLDQADPAAAAKKNKKQLEAWKALRFECLPHRALWAARLMRPKDFPDGLDVLKETIPENKFPDPAIKAEPWTLPPVARLLPEHFIVRVEFERPELPFREVAGSAVPDYLQLGFDPEEEDVNAFSENERVLELPASIRWITDFGEAEKAGMAVRIPLTKAEFQSGISRLLVLGVKTGADAPAGQKMISDLFEDHLLKPEGMSFLTSGTPTNNLEGQQAGRFKKELSDEESFHLEFRANQAGAGSDGLRLARALGLDHIGLERMKNADSRSGEEALMMNRALWPGTMGYFLDNHMRPSVKDEDIGFVKKFFLDHVTGGGLLPVLRVGKQPYGIVPATAWSAWETGPDASPEEGRLVGFLKKLDEEWARMIAKVRTIKKVFGNSDEQTLKREFRELLASQASSTRYFRRLVAGEYLLWNMNQRVQPQGVEKVGIRTSPSNYKSRIEKSDAWNTQVDPVPRMMGKFLDNENYKLFDTPPGERKKTDAGKNLLALLLDATLEQLKNSAFGEDFGKFVSHRSDRLLFHVARFALLQGWVGAATAMVREQDQKISPFARLDFEMEYVAGGRSISKEHESLLNGAGFSPQFETLKNKWNFFDQTLPGGETVAKAILKKLQESPGDEDPVTPLKEMMEALEGLSDLPAERLDRLFSEHIDTCSFRLDAWMQGLVLARLFNNRKKEGKEKGIYTGAYGYLENLKPDPRPWVRVSEVKNPDIVSHRETGIENLVLPVYDFAGLDQDQVKILKNRMFVYLGSDPETSLVENPETGRINQATREAGTVKGESGFILTPSLEHAAAAGILRAGYEHHGRSHGPESETLAIKLEPVRTGKAIEMLKALNAGFSLNEQLGYRIERNMYDNAALAAFVPATRKAFPLHIEKNEWDDDQQLREANKVNNLELIADGLAILNQFQHPSAAPGWQVRLNEIFGNNQPAKNAFGGIVGEAADLFDAVSDLVLAESVFQKVKGSPEKAAAALRMVGEGSDIALPEITGIPSESRVLSHRLGFVFNGDRSRPGSWSAGNSKPSPFSRLVPALNRWLADHLPAPDKIFARVVRENGPPSAISLSDLGIEPVDFYYMVRKTGGKPEQSLLNWLFMEKAATTGQDSPVEIFYDRDENIEAKGFTVMEIMPMVRVLGNLLDRSRPLRPEDLQAAAGNTGFTAGDLYDNSALLSACENFLGKNGIDPFEAYLTELEKSKNSMEKNIPAGFVTPGTSASFSELIRQIPRAFELGFLDALPRCPDVCNELNARVLIDQAENIMDMLRSRSQKARALLEEIVSEGSALPGDQVFEKLKRLIRLLTSDDFPVLPEFKLPDPGSVKAAHDDRSLTSSVNENNVDEWVQGLALVKENIRSYRMIRNLRKVYEAAADERRLKILQLPFLQGARNHWIGGKFPEGYEPPPGATSLAFEFSSGFSEKEKFSGILVEEWREKIPARETTGGIAIHYNQANSEAPQCMLLAVSPVQKGSWEWSNLAGAVTETMMMAKKRAVDTNILQTSWVSQFLPALVTPIDDRNNTPNLNFGAAGPAIKIPPVFDPGTVAGGGGVIARF